MDGINTEHKIYLKVLTPLHVGGIQEKDLADGLDYLKDGQDIWKVNWEKVYEDFSTDEVAKALTSKDGLYDLLFDEKEVYCKFWDSGSGDSGVIKSIVRDALGNTFIPGSSIKGALKNWVYSSLDKNPQGTKNLLGMFEFDLFRFIKPSDCYLENVKLYSTKTFNLNKDDGKWIGNWKHKRVGGNDKTFRNEGFVTDYECFSKDAETYFYLRINVPLKDAIEDKLFDLEINKLKKNIEKTIDENKKKRLEFKLKEIKNGKTAYNKVYHSGEDNPFQVLFNLVNGQTKKHIERELSFFNHFNQAEGSEDIIRTYQNLLILSEKTNNNQCLLRLSAGSGFHGITGDFQFNDHTQTGIWNQNDARKYKLSRNQSQQYVGNYMKFKSRKIAFTANEMYPMGFVLLSTEPFEGNESILSVTSPQSTQNDTNKQARTKIGVKSVEGEEMDASQVKKGDIIYGKVTKIDKPFCSVKLMLFNYDFINDASLSGVKKFKIEVGQVVKCQLGDPSSEGEFKQVRFVP